MRSTPACLTMLAFLAVALSGCSAQVVDESTLFADPARFALYDCRQLAAARKTHSQQIQELQDLMLKAETGAAGALVAELAYRLDYVSAQAKLKTANAEWERNRCMIENAKTDPAFRPPSSGGGSTAGRSRGGVY